jgi:iron complex transport system substrate-binding protein
MGLHRRTDPETLPTVACVEWMEPLMTAGHWMPDLAEMAGGRAVLAEKGTPSQVVEWDEVRAADPDVLAILPCGFTLEETRRDLHYLTERDGWNDLQAVRNGRVVLLDGNAYFNRPGPRLYRSIELLAEAIHPDAVDAEALAIEPWERQRWVNPQAVS